MGIVYVVGTCDTKGDELRLAKAEVVRAGASAKLVDISTGPSAAAQSSARQEAEVDFSAGTVAGFHPRGRDAVFAGADRGAILDAMAEALTAFFASRSDIGGVLGLGGSGNTAVVTAAMRALPLGLPKLMVSTMAAGNVAPYIGTSDIGLMYSVVDIAGLNPISRRVIGNAAHAVAGMARTAPLEGKAGKPGLGLTMFGVTTPCVNLVRAAVEKDYECYVFHATGAGGLSMEKLAGSGFATALMDLTTTEVADLLVGGVLACTNDRFGVPIRQAVPYVGSVGALDMVNFGAPDTVPERFRGRKLYHHNAEVTLMRTTADECRVIGQWIVERVNQMQGKVRFLLPIKGISALDAEGQAFWDPAADEALFDAIRDGWKASSGDDRKLVEVDANINDARFAEAAVHALREVC
jgi:uncharacterized protein (UPF0261 family)